MCVCLCVSVVFRDSPSVCPSQAAVRVCVCVCVQSAVHALTGGASDCTACVRVRTECSGCTDWWC